MDAKDAKLIGRVYSLLLQYGAISTERALDLLNEFGRKHDLETFVARDLIWAFCQLDCKEGGGLWTLPDEKLTVNQRNEIRDAKEAEKKIEAEPEYHFGPDPFLSM